MNKKNNLFIFIMLILCMFIGINRVDAATGLYCIYPSVTLSDSGFNAPDLMLIQDNDGSKYVYAIEFGVVNKSFRYDGFSWKKIFDDSGKYVFEKAITDFSLLSDEDIDSNGNLLNCPKYYIWKSKKYENVQFSSSTKVWDGSIEVELDQSLSGSADISRKSNDFNFGVVSKKSDYRINNSNFTLSSYTTEWLVEPVDGVQSCLYTYKTPYDNFQSVQLDIDYLKQRVTMSFATYDNKSSGINITKGDNIVIPEKIHTDYYYSYITRYYNKGCPIELYGNWFSDQKLFMFSFSRQLANSYRFNLTNSMPKIGDLTIKVDSSIVDIEDCDDLLGSELADILHGFVNAIKILIPIVLIVMGIVDFTQAIFGSKEDEMKKASSRFIKRVIIAVVIYFIPSFLNVLLSVANSIWGNIDPSLCGIL